MKLATATSFAFFLLFLADCQHLESTTPAIPQPDYGDLKNSIFVYNEECFAELPLDEEYNLDLKTLEEHCGPGVQGLEAHSSHKLINITNGKLNPEDGWEIFESYHCVYLPATTQSTLFSPIRESLPMTEPTTRNTRYGKILDQILKMKERVKRKRYEIKVRQWELLRKMRNTLQSGDNKVKTPLMKLELQVAIANLGRAAARLMINDTRQAVTEKKPISNLTDLLLVLQQEAHDFKTSNHANATLNYNVLNDRIQEVIRPYRYLVCTGEARFARLYIKQHEMDALLRLRTAYRTVGANKAMVLEILEIIYEQKTNW